MSEVAEEGRNLSRVERLEGAAQLVESVVQASLFDRLTVMQELVEALAREGAWAPALDLVERALAIAGEGSKRHFALLARKAWVLFRSGRLSEARELAEDLLAKADRGGNRMGDPAAAGLATRASLHRTLGGIAWQEGRIGAAIAHVRASADLYAECDDRSGRTELLGEAAAVFRYLGAVLNPSGRRRSLSAPDQAICARART